METTWDQADRPARAEAVTGWATAALSVAFLTIGLMAGLFYAWDVSVMPGFAVLDDRTFVTAMQVLVVAIENPAFFPVFLGALVSTAVAAVLHHRGGHRRAARWIAVALALYVVTLLITAVVHLPINYALVDAGDPARIGDLAAVRADFEVPWRVANLARTAACVLALLCLGRALSLAGGARGSRR